MVEIERSDNCIWPISACERSLRRHHHRQRHLAELLIPVDCVQGATNVVGYIGRATLLYPKRELHDGGFQGDQASGAPGKVMRCRHGSD